MATAAAASAAPPSVPTPRTVPTPTPPSSVAGFHDNGAFEMVKVTDMFSDPTYNRPISGTRVQKIKDNFDPDAFGMLILSERSDGMKVILDGQHRVAALILMDWQDQRAPSWVYRGLTTQREAEIFTIINRDRTRPTPFDLFRSRMVHGDTTAREINRIVEKNGLSLSDAGTPTKPKNGLRAISGLERIYRGGGSKALDDTLRIITEAWSSTVNDRFNTEIMTGVALVLVHYGAKVDQHRLANNLRNYVPTEMLAKVRVTQSGWRLSAGIAAMLVDLYNLRLRDASKRLDTVSAGQFSRGYSWKQA